MTTPLKIQTPAPLRGGLDAVALPLPDGTTEADWRVGLEVTPPARNAVELWDASGCSDTGYALDAALAGDEPPATIEEKTVNTVADTFVFYPTVILAQVECHVSGTQSAIGDIILENAKIDLELNKYRALEAVLHGAAPVHGPSVDDRNPSLNNYGDPGPSAPTIPDGFDPTAAGDLKGTIQGLLDQVCACSKSDLTFHVPVSFLPYFLTDGFVRWDEATGTYRFGSHVFSFGCYPNQGPQSVEDVSATPDDGTEVWIWTTGPVYHAFSDEDVIVEVTRAQNMATALVERAAILAFDPSCVGAAKARVA